jgi:hypothetical protein
MSEREFPICLRNRFYAHFAGRANADAANLSCPPPGEFSRRCGRCRYYRLMGRAGLLGRYVGQRGVKPMMRAMLAVLGILLGVAAVSAQSLQEIDRRYAAVLEAWEKTPLTVRRALFVSDHPHGFGLYQERASNVFKPGEALVTYAEPVGYGAKDAGNGLLEFGFAVDFLIKSPDGQILTGQQDFARLAQQSHVRNLEFMLLLTLNVTGAPSGDYVVEYKLRDISGDKTTSFELPFKIAS